MHTFLIVKARKHLLTRVKTADVVYFPRNHGSSFPYNVFSLQCSTGLAEEQLDS